MPFTVNDFTDLIRFLEQHPEWRAELRRLLLTEELLATPGRLAEVERILTELSNLVRDEIEQTKQLRESIVELRQVVLGHTEELREQSRQIAELRETVQEHSRQIAELRETVQEHSRQIAELRETVQEHSRQIAELRETVQEQSRQIAELRETVQEHSRQIAELRETVQEHSRQIAELRETVQEHSRQIAELRETVQEHSRQIAELRETVQEHSRQIAELRQAIGDLRRTVEILASRVDRMDDRLGHALGMVLELRVERRLSSWFGRRLRRLRVRPPGEWDSDLRERLGDDAYDRLLDADLLARGRLAEVPEREVWLVVEVSYVIDHEDVQRILEWADLLRALGEPVIPVVIGTAMTEVAKEEASLNGVVTVTHNERRVVQENWEKARARWVA